MRLSTVSIREIRLRPGRSLLTFLGATLGVATIVAIPVSVENTRRSFGDLFASAGGHASLEVVREGEASFSPELVPEVEDIEGVERAFGCIQSAAALPGPAGPSPVIVLGLPVGEAGPSLGLRLRSGRFPGPGEEACVLEEGFARHRGVRPGSTIGLWTPAGHREIPVSGVLEPAGAATAHRGAIVFLGLELAREIFTLEEGVNSLRIVLEKPGLQDRVARAIEARLPPGFRVQTPAARGALALTTFQTSEQLFSVLSVVAPVAAAFIILNTFLMNLAERRRQLAILRSIGLTRRGLATLLLGESLFLGILATLLGIPLGLATSTALLEIFAESFGGGPGSLRIPGAPIALALVLGPGLPVLATWLPARRAAAHSIVDALLDRNSPRPRPPSHRLPLVGLVLAVVPALLVLAMIFEWVSRERLPLLLGPGMALSLICLVLWLPLVIPPLSRLGRKLLGRLSGLEGPLALRLIDANPTRRNLTVSVLFLGVVVAIATGSPLLTNIADIRENIDRITGPDHFVRGTLTRTTLLLPTPLPESLGKELRELEGVGSVDGLSWIPTRSDDQPLTILTISGEEGETLPVDLGSMDSGEALRALERGEVLVGTGLSRKLGVGPGDGLPLETRSGTRQFRVAAIVKEYTSAGFALYLHRSVAREHFELSGVHVFRVRPRAGVRENPRELLAFEERLEAFCSSRQLLTQSPSGFRDSIDRMIAAVTGMIWSLIFLVFLVASLGVVNTITMNVLEQTRELGLLRAIGLRRRQVFQLVLAQAAALATLSFLPGVVAGTLLAYTLHICGEAVNGIPVEFRLNPGLTVTCLALTLGLALLTTLGPARRAARLRVSESLQVD